MSDTLHKLNSAIGGLKFLLQEKELLEVKIAKQRQLVAAWEIIAEQEDASGPDSSGANLDDLLDREGLTNAISTVMRASSKEWMTTSDVQAGLQDFGFDLKKYKAPHAAILTTVNRLVEKGEVEVRPMTTAGGTQYKWVGSRFSSLARAKYAPPALITDPQSPTVPPLTDPKPNPEAEHIQALVAVMRKKIPKKEGEK
jgi:hypothetical protein